MMEGAPESTLLLTKASALAGEISDPRAVDLVRRARAAGGSQPVIVDQNWDAATASAAASDTSLIGPEPVISGVCVLFSSARRTGAHGRHD